MRVKTNLNTRALLLFIAPMVLIFSNAFADTKKDSIERAFMVRLEYPAGKPGWGISSYGTAWKLYDRYLVTNKHVALACAGSKICNKTLVDIDGHEYPFEVFGVSYNFDVAIIKALTAIPGKDAIISSRPTSLGQSVYSIGFPKEVFTESTNCNIKEYLEDGTVTDCFVNPGASGSALYNNSSEVIGLVFAQGLDPNSIVNGDYSKARRLEHVQYSIPSTILIQEIDLILKGPSVIEGYPGAK